MTDPGAGPPPRPDAPRPTSSDGVLDALRAAVAEHPDDAELHRLLSMACAARSCGDEAAESFAPVPGRVCAARSCGDEALAEARAALALEPNSADSHTVLGIALHEKDWGKAQRAYREALRLDPAQIDADLNLALAQARSGRLAEGIDRAARVVRREPASPWARWTLDRLLTRWCAEVYLTGAVIWLLCMLAVTQSPESLNPVKGALIGAALSSAFLGHLVNCLLPLRRVLPGRGVLASLVRRDRLLAAFALCGPPAWLMAVVALVVDGGRPAPWSRAEPPGSSPGSSSGSSGAFWSAGRRAVRRGPGRGRATGAPAPVP